MEGKAKIKTFLVCVFLSVPAVAQENPTVLTWPDAVKAALEGNPALLSARRAFESSRYSYRAALNGLFPDLSLSSRYSTSDSPNRNTRWQASGSASLDIFNLGTYADVRSSLADKDRAHWAWNLAAADVGADIRGAFVELLFAQEQIEVNRKIRDIRKRNADLVSLKYESGRESKGNMLRSKADLSQADADLAQAERALRVSQRELTRQLGWEGYSDIIATGTLDVSSFPTLQDSLATAVEHPRLLIQDATLRRTEASLASARSQLWPSVSASYTRSVTGPDYFPDNDYGWTAAGILSIPLFSGGPTAAYNRIKAARRDLQAAEQDFKATRMAVFQTLESAWASLADSLDAVRVQREFLVASRQRNDEASIRYSSGLMSYEDWERAVSDLVNFERGTIRAERQAALAQAEIDRAMGLSLEKL